MSKDLQDAFDGANPGPKPAGPLQALREGVQAALPGATLEKVFGDLAEAGGRLFTQGRAELAQALFTDGTAYVPYGPGQNGGPENDSPLHGPAAGPEQSMEREPPAQGREIG